MRYNQLFNYTQFKLLYNTCNNVTINKKARDLEQNDKEPIYNKANLFSYSHYSGTEYSLDYSTNPGINSKFFEYENNFKAGEKKYNLMRVKEESNFNEMLEKLSCLSKAGNKLVLNLYKKIYPDFNILTELIKNNITRLNNLIVYQDILKLFDSSYSLNNLTSLPSKTVELSDYLSNGLDNILNNIMNNDLKMHIDNLKNNIENYISQSQKYVYNLEDNLKQLKNSLGSKKSGLTEIATYYLNNTPDSYSDIIIKAKDILMNYYKYDNNSITPKIETIIDNFEEKLRSSIQSETEKLNNLLNKLEDNRITIDTNNEDTNKVISNLKKVNNNLYEIIKLIKEKIKKAIGLKDNNYFLTNGEIESKIDVFNNLINDAIDIANKLDNDELIDKIFDNIMILFKANITQAIKFMDTIKEQQFALIGNPLNSFFTISDQKNIAGEIKDLYIEISRKLNKENKFYLDSLQEKLDAFLGQNKEKLNTIINELMIKFSEEDLKKLSNLYNESIKILGQYITSNQNLAKDYFDELSNILFNDSKLGDILHDYMQGELPYKDQEFSEIHYVYLKSHEQSNIIKKLAQGYTNKYTTFKNNFQNSIDYINDHIYFDYLTEYKKLIINLKKLLQTIKNTKISNLYPDFNDLKFTDENIEKIDILYTRLNKYFSDDIFNQKYINQINEFKKRKTELQETKKYLEDLNDKIKYDKTIPDITNDFCYSFHTKAFYTCTNSQLSYYKHSDNNYCLNLKNSQNSNKIKDISIYNIKDINTFINEFNKFYKSIEEKVNLYDSIMNKLKNILFSVKEEAIEKKYTDNYLLPLEESVNSILADGDEIIKGLYDYYKNDTRLKIEEILSNISNKWESIFDLLNKEIEKNQNKLNSGTYEFGIMAQVTSILINGNITKNLFNSIVNHQKNDFNYSISYYYNFLIRLIKSAYKYVLNYMPINKNGFNDILNLRKKEINEFFNYLLAKINQFKEKSCSSKHQIEVLQINEKNFFGIQIILSENIKNMNDSLSLKSQYPYMFFIENNEYSFINRFYLENSEIGKQIKEYYNEIDDRKFIKLKEDVFINMVKENLKIIFDKNEFINRIESLLINSNKKIENSFSNEKKDYISDLESLISPYFTKDIIIEEINRLYKSEVKEMEQNKIEEIYNNINDILKKITEKMSSEAKRLATTSVSLTSNYSLIESTLNEYKNEIFNKLNETIFSVLKDFHKNITEKLLNNYVEAIFVEFLNKATIFTANFQEIQTLNNTYQIKNVILDIIQQFSIEYKNITEMQIEHKYKQYVEEITNRLDLYKIKNTIDKEIENNYNSTLYSALKKYAINNPGDSDFYNYNFSQEIKDEIEGVIKTKMNNINNIVLTTKGNNFTINLSKWDNGFDDIFIYIEIEKKFKSFMEIEMNEEKDNFKSDIKDIIEINFKETINDIISSFGKDFFDRIIKYNENFKITSLYNNLKYSLFQTISYYIMLTTFEDVEELPRDLKLKLYNLNNLDLIAKEKNQKVLDILEDNIDIFIKDSKDQIISFFISNIDQYIIKENIFNIKISEEISSQLNEMKEENEIGNYYTNLLEDNFKRKFITSYSDTMNNNLYELIELINYQKEMLKVEIDNCFTLEPEEVLNDINNKLNITLNSINDYYNNKFNISEDFKDYLNNYGNDIIKPYYTQLINFIDESTKDIIINNINKHIKDYEDKLNIEEFNNGTNDIFLSTKEIFEKIKNFINIYGLNDKYYDNLDKEIKQIELRRAEETITDENNKQTNKNIPQMLSELRNNSENAAIFINSFEGFNNFDNYLSEDFTNLDISFKKSKDLIKKNNYSNEINDDLLEKLNYLKNITSNYYFSINDTLYNLKDYLDKSILEINELLYICENSTYNAFSKKYESISDEVQNIDKNYNTNEKSSPIIYNTTWENTNNIKATAKMDNLIKKGKFKFIYNYEKGSSPLMRVELINEGKPEELDLKIEDSYGVDGDCGKKVEEIKAKFNNVSFITYIDYNITTNKINMTKITEFDSFDYSICKYKKGVSSGSTCRMIMGLQVCTGSSNCQKESDNIQEKTKNRTYIINTEIFDA